MIDFDPIHNLLQVEPDIGKHAKLEHTSNLRQVGGGCNRAIYRPLEATPDSRHTDLHRACPEKVVYKVNRTSIPASKKKKMLDCLKFLEDNYALLKEIGSSKGLNILPFSTKLISDKNGNLRVVYAEPDVGEIFKDPRIIDLAHANTYSNPQTVLADDKALNSLSNIIDFCKEFHRQTKSQGRSMYPDIWGENNILGIKDKNALEEYSLKLDPFPQNSGYPLFGNSSLLKANGSEGLFNQRPDFRLVIFHTLESMKRLVDQIGKNTEERILRPTPMESVLFFLADTKTQMSKAGINF